MQFFGRKFTTKTSKEPVRAEAPTHPDFRDKTHPFPALQALDFRTEDGAWWCCRDQCEHKLVHWIGPHPFDPAKCPCGHTICHECVTTDILTVVDSAQEGIFTVPETTSQNVPYGQICPCGILHRAKRRELRRKCDLGFNVVCSCGRKSSLDWLRFVIGSNMDWRLRSNECEMRSRNIFRDRRAHPANSKSIARVGHRPIAVRDEAGFFLPRPPSIIKPDSDRNYRKRGDAVMRSPVPKTGTQREFVEFGSEPRLESSGLRRNGAVRRYTENVGTWPERKPDIRSFLKWRKSF
ncbi:hypothetical protein K505DRAFT_390853 [Melanomma pulvis-pyrius CBS 109.77]|uniref:Probable double zinc ribbon domain-containing protein n=1 Tax=Melanomma pulvis-pyrius CBS 109.77 TaxID=1314802 RepID=A0A6A6X2R1_9PLEO|nr:hypothetical protein K505DRAFT_390853 [Melanomma pulvis-pyrius CBS 109.77]